MEPTTPSLTERRKRATQLDIARTDARLFADRGARAVTAEEIAQQSGIAVRTFYRYFSSKEDAVAPLLTVGAGHWRALSAASDPDENLIDALERAIVEVLTPHNDAELDSLRDTLGLLRAAAATDAPRVALEACAVDDPSMSDPGMLAACAARALRELTRGVTSSRRPDSS